MTTIPTLKKYKGIPPGFLDCPPRDLLPLLGGPALLQIGMSSAPPVFLSTLLHGNETSGWTVVQQLLKEYDHHAAHRPLLLFIGNVYAAQAGVRKLDTTSDYNRIWRGGECPEKQMAAEVLSLLQREKPFVSIDLHNNTGRNPVYGCIRDLNETHLALASLFSNTALHTERPCETLTHVMTDLCPAITCECGLPGAEEGIQKALDFVRDCLHLKELPDRHLRKPNLNVYYAVGRIHLPHGSTVDFANGPKDADFTFEKDFDLWNFTQLPAGHVFGWRKKELRLILMDEQGKDISQNYFAYKGREIVLANSFAPAMLTRIPSIIFQDCLGYVMLPTETKP